MAKFSGYIGYVKKVEDPERAGTWTDDITEKKVCGNTLKSYMKDQDHINDSNILNMTDKLSVLADSYILENLQVMKYVKLKGIKWKISSFSIAHPRIILTLGGLYNG